MDETYRIASLSGRAARWMRLAFAFVVALSLCLPSTSASARSSSHDMQIAALSRVDLNASWRGIEGGLDSPFTISEGGTYYLSSDLSSGNGLVINAPDADVTIEFAGHEFKVNGNGAVHKTMVSIEAARSVSFNGASSAGESALASAGDTDVWAVSSAATGCAVSANDLAVRLASTSNAQRNLSTHCFRIESGSLALARCRVTMGMGNQSLRSSILLNDREPEVPSAVYATSGVSEVSLVDCSVQGEGPAGFSLEDISDATTIGNAYALYSLAGTTRVQGGSYKAESLRGNATCIYAANLKVEGGTSSEISLEADAGQLATGILSTRAAGASIDAPVSFSVGGEYEGRAQAAAALRSSVQGGFVFGDCVSVQGGTCPVLVMTGNDVAAANADGFYLGTFADGTDSSRMAAVLSCLENALGSSGACTVTSDLVGVRFSLSPADALARVTDKTGATTHWSTIAEALGKLASSDGATLTLLEDAGPIEVGVASGATIDLNGHAVESLGFSAPVAGAGLTVRGGSIGPSRISVNHESPAPLSLVDVEVTASASDADATGVYAAKSAGKLTLSGSSIRSVVSQASASGKAAYGINMASNGPELSLEGTSVLALTASAGAAVYGVYSSSAAEVSSSSIAARGATGTTCALYVGGSLAAKGSSFDARTTGLASTACSAWMRTTSPVATDVSFDSCSFAVSSAAPDVSGANYSCLLGATVETGAPAPLGTLSLSGASSFSSSGIHLGLNIANVSLADSFSLDGGSDSPLVISQSQRASNAGFELTGDVSGSRAAKLANLFQAKEGSCYEGWRLAPDSSGSRLVWRSGNDPDGTGVVALVHGSSTTRFASVVDALGAAAAGDTVRLLADLSESGCLAVGQKSLTLDLNGKSLTVRAGSAASAAGSSGAAMAFDGAGMLTVRNGTLALQVGAASEIAAGATYQGIAVTGGGTLAIARDATVNVDYAGSTASSAAQREVALRGVVLGSGSLDLAGSLVVTGAASDGAIGSLRTYGIYADPLANARVAVEVTASATVQVDGRTGAAVTKNTYYADSAGTQASPPGLREIEVGQQIDAAFYEDLVAQFRATATYDDPTDITLRNTFGTRIYFAQAMALSHEGAWYDGLKVWAFSDEVSAADAGKMERVVPTRVFVSTPYDTLPEAFGVAVAEDAAGTADLKVEGKVAAASLHGSAYGVLAENVGKGNVSASVEGADIEATCDAEAHPIARRAFDLRDFISFTSEQTEKVAYSTFPTSKFVEYGCGVARDAVIGEGKPGGFSPAAIYASDVIDAVRPPELERVPISFTNVFNQTATLQDAVAFEANYGQTIGAALEEAGLEVPDPADYESDGVTYRFVGWYPYSTTSPSGPLLYDSNQVRDLQATLAVNGASSSGAIELRAVYLAISPGQHIVFFVVDGATSACVVDDGAFPVYTAANDTNTSYTVPAKIATETGKTFTFSSWKDKVSGISYDAALPRAYADATYVAQWAWVWSNVTLTFHIKHFDEATGALNDNGVQLVETTYGTPTQDIADSIVKIGDEVGYGGRVYVFDGWAVRKSDVEPVYGESNPLPSVTGDDRALSSDYAKTFYGVYTSADHVVSVSFFDGDSKLGSTATVVATKTSVNEALKAAGAEVPADKSGSQAFLGWAVESGSTNVVNGSVPIENIVDGAASELVLYASFGPLPTYTVRLRNEDGSKVLYRVLVKRGRTVAAMLERKGVKASAPTKKGSYFAGWVSASGAYYDLEAPATGSANLYASYGKVRVVTADKSDITATVTVPSSYSTAWPLGQMKRVTFSLAPRTSADTPLRSTAAANGYSILKCYDMRLDLSLPAGKNETVQGSFGTASCKVYVGTRYAKSKVRVFWLGLKDGAETVMNSDVKQVDSEGYITVSIGNYEIGDADEGGNLAIAYVEGGSGAGVLSVGSGASPGLGTGSGTGLSARTAGLTASFGPTLGSSSGGSLAKSPLSLSGSAGSNAPGAGKASLPGGQDTRPVAASDAGRVAGTFSVPVGAQAMESAGGGEAQPSPFDGWGSEAAVLVLVVAGVLVLGLRGVWQLLVVRPRREEAEAEMPEMAEQYTKGIAF